MTDNNSNEQTVLPPPAGEQISSKRPVWIIYVCIILFLCVLLVGIIAGGAYIFSSQVGRTVSGNEATTQASIQQTQPVLDPTQEAASQWPLLFSDDFSIDNNRWDTGQLENNCIQGSRQIIGGKYKLEFEAKDSCVSWEYPDISTVSNFYITVDAEQLSESSSGAYGLVLRNTGSNYYFFLIRNDGTIYFERLYADNYNPFIEGVKSPAIRNNGVNRLSVIARGSHFSLYINDKLVGQIDDDKLKIGSAGIMVSYETGSKLSFDFDNFEIRAAPIQSPSGANLTPTVISSPHVIPEAEAGGHIAFASNRDGNYSIYTIKTDGTELTRLTNDSGDDFSPDWSPDGKLITFVSTRHGNSDIYVMNSDGSAQKQLTVDPGEDTSPAWSPDGKQIVFVSTRQGSHDIYLMNADGSHQAGVIDDPGEDTSPAWSPDGRIIAFQSNRQAHKYNIYTTKPDGSQTYRKTYHLKYAGEPSWSPDGKYMAFVSSDTGNREIYVKDEGSGDQKNISNNPWDDISPTWSPDGKWIAFVSVRDGKNAIYMMGSDGSNLKLLVDMEGDQKTPSWTSK